MMPKVDGVKRAKAPTRATLKRYGLTEPAWFAICVRQGFRCPVCSEPFGERKLVVDHAHVRRFKKMKPEQRRLYVRGVLHSFCNRYVRGWLTLKRAEGILGYLKEHEKRLQEGTL